MNTLLKTALALAVAAAGTQAYAQITLYEHENFDGRSFTAQRQLGQLEDFERSGFNDRASSAEVLDDRWEVCEDAHFGGRCVVLRRGRYASMSAMGLNDRISSVRSIHTNERIDDSRYGPAPVADYSRRRNERLYEANVTSARAVLGTPDRRCWIEREQVSRQQRSDANIPGAIIGAVVGGILGHQVGGGTGRSVATAGGAVVGGVVGSKVGRDSGGTQTVTQDVRRCESTPNAARPDYWDVTYDFRGQEHRVQMTAPPGDTVIVNQYGEPRV